MTPTERRILVMFFEDNMNTAEIGRALDQPESSVERLLHAARKPSANELELLTLLSEQDGHISQSTMAAALGIGVSSLNRRIGRLRLKRRLP